MWLFYSKIKQTTTVTPLKTDNLVVYPNPFSETISFNIRLKEQTTVDIALYSMAGTVLYTEKLALPAGDHNHTISINVPSGAYLLKVDYGNKHKSTIVIKS